MDYCKLAIGNLALWQFIHCPVIVASVDHNNAGKAAASADTFRWNRHERDREFVPSVPHRLSTIDLISGGFWIGKKTLDHISIGRVLGMSSKQHHPVLEIASLPCLQEVIGSRKSWQVSRVQRRGRSILGRQR